MWFVQLWQEQGLDLELIPYGCMATSPYTGFIEVVKNARTIKEVSQFTCCNDAASATLILYRCLVSQIVQNSSSGLNHTRKSELTPCRGLHLMSQTINFTSM